MRRVCLANNEKNGIPETGRWYWKVMENRVVEHQIHLNIIQNSAEVHAENLRAELPTPNTHVRACTYMLYCAEVTKPLLEVSSFAFRAIHQLSIIEFFYVPGTVLKF